MYHHLKTKFQQHKKKTKKHFQAYLVWGFSFNSVQLMNFQDLDAEKVHGSRGMKIKKKIIPNLRPV